MNATPQISVILPVYNNGSFLHEAIDSILNQTFQDFELIIINDGSTDNSENIILGFRDSRIRYIKNPVNLGLIATLNKGIDLATGEFIARMDGDDISMPSRFEKQLAFFEKNPGFVMVSTFIKQIDIHGNAREHWAEDRMAVSLEQIKKVLPQTNCMAHPSIMIRKDIIKNYKYIASQKDSEDWDLWLRLVSDGEKIGKIDEELLKYRLHDKSATAQYSGITILKKIMAVQENFLLHKIKSFTLNAFDVRVLIAYLNNCLYPLKRLYVKVINVLKINPFLALVEFVSFRFTLKSKIGDSKLFFFFPYYHVGGAEKVHAEIVACFKDEHPIVFISRFSNGNGFEHLFLKNAKVLNIARLMHTPVIKKWTQQIIQKVINSKENGVVFGSNSSLFYNVLPGLKNEIKVIDLIHAFVHKNEIGAEHTSLPHVKRIDKRIFISRKAIEDLKNQYEVNAISQSLLDRVVYIPNCIDVPLEYLQKIEQEKATVLFIGRNADEKRVPLALEIADSLKHLPLEFVFVGPLESFKKGAPGNCSFTGEVKDETQLHAIYLNADFLLLTSAREGFPMVIMEAMAMGVIPVSTAVGDIPNHIHHMKNGALTNQLNVFEIKKELAGHLEKLYLDLGLRKEISLNAYHYALEKFNKEQFNKAYRRLILDK